MHSRDSSEPVLLFANPPLLEELCAITLFVQKQSQVLPTFQPQIIKCRELIFTEPDIVATPSFDFDNCLHIVMQQSLFKTGRLQNRFQKIGLDASKPYRVSPALYESCLKYTLTAKIAPHWNKAGEWMLQGRDFLTHTGYANAVNINLRVNKDELFLSVLASAVRFPPLQLEHLCLDENQNNSILQSPEGCLHQVSVADCWCHVLPSMKRGRIFSICRGVPDDGPFKCYRDFKRHWKNTYGYRLPETDDDLLFYEVTFRASGGGKMFTYPGVCLRATNMQKVPRVEWKPILVEFLQDLHAKMSSVCGHHLRFVPKLRYAIPELYGAGEEKRQNATNLSNKNPAASSTPLRNFNDLQHLYNSTIVTSGKTRLPAMIATTASNSTFLPPKAMLSQFVSQEVQHGTSTITPHFHTVNTPSQPDIIPPSQPESMANKMIPMFRSKTVSTHSDSSAKKVIPSFKPKQKASSKDGMGLQDNCSLYTSNKIVAEYVSQSAVSIPTFKPNRTTAPSSFSIKHVSNFSNKNKHAGTATSNSSQQSQMLYNEPQQHQFVSSSTAITDVTSRPLSTPDFNPKCPTPDGKKRKSAGTTEDLDVKKPRPRQQVQNVDVEQLARCNQLGKVNLVTLTAWLKERGVPCKSKDKKAELVGRVMHILSLSQAES